MFTVGTKYTALLHSKHSYLIHVSELLVVHQIFMVHFKVHIFNAPEMQKLANAHSNLNLCTKVI